MTEHAATFKPEEKKRYEGQRTIVAQIVTIFDDPGYSPENVEQGVKIVTLMNEVCALHRCLPPNVQIDSLTHTLWDSDAIVWCAAIGDYGPAP